MPKFVPNFPSNSCAISNFQSIMQSVVVTPSNQAPALVVSVFPDRLRMVALKKNALEQAGAAFVRLFLFASRPRFFAYSETDESISLIIGSRELETLLQSALKPMTVSPMLWTALRLLQGPQNFSSLMADVSRYLSRQNFSIFYVSAFSDDYLLVKSDELKAALSCLESRFLISVEHLDSSPMQVEGNLGIRKASSDKSGDCAYVESHEDKKFENISPTEAQKPRALIREVQVQVLKNPHYLISVKGRNFDMLSKAILHLLFQSDRNIDLFSFIDVDNNVSMILNGQMALDFQKYSGDVAGLHRPLSVIKILGNWAFEETGLVNSISQPLTNAKIDIFYISTIHTGFVLMDEDQVDKAQETLRQSGISLK